MMPGIRSQESLFTGSVVEARYHETNDPMYRHNAYIEALPPLFDDEKAASLMEREPSYNEQERLLSDMQRLHAVQRISDCIFPLPEYLLLMQKFQRMIRDGYMARNPLSKEWVKQINIAFPSLDWDNGYEGYIPPIRLTAAGFNVVGASGVGKSTLVESILFVFPQVIIHHKYNDEPFEQKQLVWLKLDCPFDGSLKGLCMSFFHAIDQVLGTSYASRFSNRMTVDSLIPIMAKLAGNLGLGVLVIDEIQRLLDSSSGGAQKMLNFFVQLTNTIGVPVVMVGTYKAFRLFNKEFASARRGAGQGDTIMGNMAHDEYWDYFLEKIWRYQFTNTLTLLTPKLNWALYEESQGIADIAIKLYMFAQWQLIGSGDERLTPELFSDVASANLNAAGPMLAAMRTKDFDALGKIEDMFLPKAALDECLNAAEHRVALYGTLDTLRNRTRATKGAVDEIGESPVDSLTMLVQAGYERALAMHCAQMAVNRFAAEDNLTSARKEALRLASEAEARNDKAKAQNAVKAPSTKKVKAGTASLSGDLREIIKKAPKNMPPYEALLQAGVIKSADELWLSIEA